MVDLAEARSAQDQAQAEPTVQDVRPVSMPVLDRVASGVVTALPPLLVVVGMVFGWTSHLLVWQDLLILAICCTSLLIVGMDVTIVNVALPAIQRDLHAPLAGLRWILDAYTLVVASF